jgi:hypothetical protein
MKKKMSNPNSLFLEPPVYVVIHCATVGTKYHEILESILKRIIENKPFYERIKTIYIFTVGQTNINISKHSEKLRSQHLSDDASVGESLTIKTLAFMNLEENSLILYVHSKGVSYDPNSVTFSNVTAWRKYLEYFMIDRWQDCLKKIIEAGFDTVGTEIKAVETKNTFTSQYPSGSYFIPRHYSGNFWWAKFSLIKRRIRNLGSFRNAVEFWICSDGNIKAFNFFNSNKNLYLEKIEESEYIGK